jgi:hypothetical protein
MKVTLTSTSKIVEVNGVPARIWEGVTESGTACFAFITCIAPTQEYPIPSELTAEFAADLSAQPPPSPAVDAIPARLRL